MGMGSGFKPDFLISLGGLFLLMTFVSFCISLDCTTEEKCSDSYGNFSTCKDGKCECVDFYGLFQGKCIKVGIDIGCMHMHIPHSTLDYFCIKAKSCFCEYVFNVFTIFQAVAHGSECSNNGECRITLGQATSICNATTGLCDCFDPTGTAEFLNGRCYKVKALGEACTEDGQCILGSNDMSRCTNQTCQCYTDDLVKLVPGETGFCQLEDIQGCPEAKTSLSVFAATTAGSVAIFVVIVLIYQTTRLGRT
jgi:hypothetical protein